MVEDDRLLRGLHILEHINTRRIVVSVIQLSIFHD